LKGQYLGIRKTQRFILKHRVAVLAALVLACFFDWVVTSQRHTAIPTSAPGASTSSFAHRSLAPMDARLSPIYSGRSGRVVYPYSVIPGGINNILELKNAIAKDPVVSSHYAAFRLSRARIIRLDQERLMHVSYRFGNQVYWTKRVMKIAKGETLITDGVHTARTRCGNQIAEIIPAPVSPSEPTPEELNTPVGTDFNNPFHPADVSAPAPGESSTESGPTSGGGTTPIILIPPAPSTPVLWVPLPGPPPVVRVPEPGTALLWLTALPILFFLRRRNRKNELKIERQPEL